MTIKGLLASASLALALGTGSAHAATNLIVNGGFETGDFTGFIETGATGAVHVSTSQAGYLPEEGADFAALGSSGLNFLSQTFADTSGQALLISYYLASNGDTPSEFQTTYDGVVLADLVDPPATNHLYTEVSFTVAATGSDTLTLGSKDGGATYLALDNVSVTPLGVSGAPEPSTWALLVGGVGIIGSSLRRNRTGVARAITVA